MKTPIRLWSQRLLRRFSPRRVLLNHDGPTPIDGGEGKHLQVVVGRDLCLFLTVDASKAPARQRAEFLSFTVRRAAPFADVAHAATWSNNQASVWYWSQGRVNDLLGPQPYRVSHYMPEALLSGEPASEDRVDLLAMARGFSGRVWRGGRLIADRWWPDLPDHDAWISFLRSAGLPAAAVPAASPAPIQAASWARQQRSRNLALGDSALWMRRGAVLAGALACAVLGFEAGAGFRGLGDYWSSKKQQQALDQPLNRIIEARADAEREAGELQELLSLRAPRGQVQLLAEIKRIMPAEEWRVFNWRQPAQENLEVTFVMENPDATALVAAWESSPMFTNVSSDVDTVAKRVTVKAQVVSAAQEAQAAAAPAEATADTPEAGPATPAAGDDEGTQ